MEKQLIPKLEQGKYKVSEISCHARGNEELKEQGRNVKKDIEAKFNGLPLAKLGTI